MKNSQKVALITGAARRIGAEIARILHQNGMNVVLHYHTSQKEAEELAGDLNSQRENSAKILCADLGVTKNITQLVHEAVDFWGRLDVLVNNASQFYKTPLGSVNENQWEDLLNANLKAPFFLSQAVIPFLEKQRGCIVNIADIHGERPMRDYSVYCISKAGLVMLTKAMAKELGENIRINAISPGPIIWPEKENELTSDMKKKMIERTALKREGNASEIAKAVLYLVRDAEYVTGQVLMVDGGRSLNL